MQPIKNFCSLSCDAKVTFNTENVEPLLLFYPMSFAWKARVGTGHIVCPHGYYCWLFRFLPCLPLDQSSFPQKIWVMSRHTLNPYYANFGIAQGLLQPQKVCSIPKVCMGTTRYILEGKKGYTSVLHAITTMCIQCSGRISGIQERDKVFCHIFITCLFAGKARLSWIQEDTQLWSVIVVWKVTIVIIN